ncbi:MAG TPA: DUF192 domain-containing protein [Dehalococcoidia bacterium]|nr:DUF192 domain-containing protein [Dehalococcoidia bacterium]
MKLIWSGSFTSSRLQRAAALAAALMLALCGCVSSHAQSRRPAARAAFAQASATPARRAATVQQSAQNGLPAAAFTTADGQQVQLYVEIADTEPARELGLMNRPSMPDDQGMAFLWSTEVTESFWMKDTLIPLSIAFIDANGTIVDIQEMQAETLDAHTPAAPYQVAIEANATWYARNGLQAGDSVDLSQVFAASSLFNPQASPTPDPGQ